MKHQLVKRELFLALITAAIFATGCATNQEITQPPSSSTEAPTTLTGDEIRALISGKTVEGRLSDGYYFKAYNAPDGKVSAISEKGGKTYQSSGTWEIEDNTICAVWSNKDWKSACHTYTKIGDTYQSKPTSFGVPSLPIAKFTEGNPYNL